MHPTPRSPIDGGASWRGAAALRSPDVRTLWWEQMELRNLRDSIRTRPSVYIGSTDVSGLHNVVYNAVTFALDSTLAGLGDRVSIVIGADGWLEVSGTGCPGVRDALPGPFRLLAAAAAGWVAEPALQSDEYRLLQGPYRLELPIVAALSRRLSLEMCDGAARYRGEHRYGVPHGDLVVDAGDAAGFVIRCDPDPEVLPARDYEFETLVDRFRELACLTRGICLEARDERAGLRQSCGFAFGDGPAALLRYYNHPAWWALHDIVSLAGTYDGLEVSVALQYHAGEDWRIWAFSNTARTETASTPLDGFFRGLRAALGAAASDLAPEALRRGLTAVVSVVAPAPPFDFGTYSHFTDPRAQEALARLLVGDFAAFLQANPETGRRIARQCRAA